MAKFFKAAQVEFKEHQKRVAKKLADPDRHGLLVYHNLGSGKTLTAINAAQELGAKATVVVPASLQENFHKEVKKAKAKPGQFDVRSYEKFMKAPYSDKNDMLIMDEAHRIRNATSKRSQTMRNAAGQYGKVMLLTGTPIQNKPSDIAPLINTVAGDNRLPMDEKEFNKRYVDMHVETPGFFASVFKGEHPHEVVRVKREEDFRQKVHGLVDYHNAKNPIDYPDVQEHTVNVAMTPRQTELYNYFEQQLPRNLRKKIKNSLPPSKQESTALNSFLSATRQVSNTSGSFTANGDDTSPKIQSIVNKIKSTKGPSVVYSNYLDSGLMPLANNLQNSRVPYGVFTGKQSQKEKADLVKKYNGGKLKALLISSSGGEGLDLKNTEAVHIMEPHWNDPKIEQVVGRAARYKSHAALPKEKQKVDVYRYISAIPDEGPNFFERLGLMKHVRPVSADQYLTNLSNQKKHLNNQFLNILKEEGSK